MKQYGVRPSICLSQHGPTAANPLRQVCFCGSCGQETSIDCCSSNVWRTNAGRATLSAYVGSWTQTCCESEQIIYNNNLQYAFSALTLLVGRQVGQPACKKTEWWGAGVVICLERCADLHTAQLMPLPLTVSCFSKIQIGFTFLVPAHLSTPRSRQITMPAPHHSVFYRPQALPAVQPTASKH